MQTIGHKPGVRGQWAREAAARNQQHTHAAANQGEKYGGRLRVGVAQNTGIMEIKSHPCSADPRHIELSGRLIHARDSQHPTLSGIKVAVGDEQLALTSRCRSALRDSKIEWACAEYHFCTPVLAENVGNLIWQQKVCSCKNWPSTCLELRVKISGGLLHIQG